MLKLAAIPTALLAAALLGLPAAPAQPARGVKVVNLSFNTADDEDDPFLSSDGKIFYYSANSKKKFDIMFAQRRTATAPWGEGMVLQDYIQTEGDDRAGWVGPEGRYPQYMYFASTGEKKRKSHDIFVAVKQGRDKAFTEARALTTVDTEADELHPWLAADGKELYFSRKTRDGWRVFVVKRPRAVGPAGWGEPELLADLPPGFHHATLSPDGKTMYLQGPLEKGRWGLFVSTRSAKGWTNPEALDMLNDPDAPTGDRSPSLTRDGSRLYFASDRDGGKGGLDIWAVETALLKKR